MTPTLEHLLTYAVAFTLAVLAAARLTRLMIHDAWPPTRAVRRWFLARTDEDGWQPLLTCPFCLAPWFAAADLGWAYWCQLAGPWGTAWWLVNVWLAGSYLAAMVVLRDEPPEEG